MNLVDLKELHPRINHWNTLSSILKTLPVIFITFPEVLMTGQLKVPEAPESL